MLVRRRGFAALSALMLVGALSGCRQPGAPVPSEAGAAGPPPDLGVSDSLHFAVASDGHFGEPGVDAAPDFAALVESLNAADRVAGLDFVVLNGDISHGGVGSAQRAKSALVRLQMPYYLTQGNHDELSPQQWQQVWGVPGNQVRRFGDRSIVLANTSNQAGDYLCADAGWLAGALKGESGQRDVLVFMHITAKQWTKHGIDCPKVRSLLASTANVRAVFSAHDHDQLGVKIDQGLPHFFDGHFGGSWGSELKTYRDVMVTATGLSTAVFSVGGAQLSQDSISW